MCVVCLCVLCCLCVCCDVYVVCVCWFLLKLVRYLDQMDGQQRFTNSVLITYVYLYLSFLIGPWKVVMIGKLVT